MENGDVLALTANSARRADTLTPKISMLMVMVLEILVLLYFVTAVIYLEDGVVLATAAVDFDSQSDFSWSSILSRDLFTYESGNDYSRRKSMCFHVIRIAFENKDGVSNL